ncbi:hypothetical protein MS2017_1363 [Bathymodiolus thermophilus thioautotrophic gill symbiont]|uniref:Uncharacterized protein n=1 Tax=Bathymodiolus thermophilus thioautotrophic gill symbiont TaxID=2360 RepID=A0A3G3IMN5_9GAMM|nr:hypothetical protein [Bathymodiolus thermophilus thioautotrophic gill symbiont]AYQ57051.1 hypothetical protein MS2017_1363 [Bathymodiolus thermophilus thioautotrophic gill symbiont]
MNAINTTSYPQIQAIKPTENMQWQQKNQTTFKVFGGLLVVIGGGMAAYSDINHISDTVTILGAMMFFVGAFTMFRNTYSCQYLTNKERQRQAIENKSFNDGLLYGVGSYGSIRKH